MRAREGRSVLASEIVAGASFFLFLPSLTRSLVLFRPPAPLPALPKLCHLQTPRAALIGLAMN